MLHYTRFVQFWQIAKEVEPKAKTDRVYQKMLKPGVFYNVCRRFIKLLMGLKKNPILY